jgi:hypothetical protein
MTNTKNIKIQGYRELIPNSTFGKKTKMEIPMFGEVPATFVTQIVRYQICSPKQVVETIQRAAVEYQIMSEEEKKREVAGVVPVATFIGNLPEDEIKRIIRGNSDSLEHLRSHYESQRLESGKYYLAVVNGTVPDEILRVRKDELVKEGFVGYEKLLENGRSNHWFLTVKLPQSQELPEKSEVDYLLERGVRDSFVFRVEGNENYQEFAEYFRTLYDALAKDNNLGKIEDNSDVFLKSRAALTIKRTAECIGKRNQIPGLEGLAEMLSGMGKIVGMGVIEIPMPNHEEHNGGNGYGVKPSNN